MADPEQEETKPLPPTPAAPQAVEKTTEEPVRIRSNLDIVNDCDR